jgi:hypothetical protein
MFGLQAASGRRPLLTRYNWMISPGTHPRSAPEAENVVVNQSPGKWRLFAFPSIELPPPGTAFSDTWGVLPAELLVALDQHGQDGTWWFAKIAQKERSTTESRYLTITYHGAGQYELRHEPSSARHPFILASANHG